MFISSFCSKSIMWVPVSFLSLLVPCTFLFHFSYPSLFPLFCNHTQPSLWASWLPVFWTLLLIGCLPLHRLVVFLELWSILSFGPYFFISVYLLCVRDWALGVHQGGKTLFAAPWCCMWGMGQCCLLCSCPTFCHVPHFPQSVCAI